MTRAGVAVGDASLTRRDVRANHDRCCRHREPPRIEGSTQHELAARMPTTRQPPAISRTSPAIRDALGGGLDCTLCTHAVPTGAVLLPD